MDNTRLLELLSRERAKFTKADEELMKGYIKELQSRGVYPMETVPGNPNTVFQMVQGWGAYWYQWSSEHTWLCPNCNADLRSHEAGPPFMRTIHVKDPIKGFAYWECPDCKQKW